MSLRAREGVRIIIEQFGREGSEVEERAVSFTSRTERMGTA